MCYKIVILSLRIYFASVKVKYTYSPTSSQFDLKVVPETAEEYFRLLEFDARAILNYVIDQANTELKNSFVITEIKALDEQFNFVIKTQPAPSPYES